MPRVITEHRFQHAVYSLGKLLVHFLNCSLETYFRIVFLFFIKLVRSLLLLRMQSGFRFVGVPERFLADPSLPQIFLRSLKRSCAGFLLALHIREFSLCLLSPVCRGHIHVHQTFGGRIVLQRLDIPLCFLYFFPQPHQHGRRRRVIILRCKAFFVSLFGEHCELLRFSGKSGGSPVLLIPFFLLPFKLPQNGVLSKYKIPHRFHFAGNDASCQHASRHNRALWIVVQFLPCLNTF